MLFVGWVSAGTEPLLMARFTWAGNAQLYTVNKQSLEERKIPSVCCIPNKCLTAGVTRAAAINIENIMLQLQKWWQEVSCVWGVTKDKLSRGRMERYPAFKPILCPEQGAEPWQNVRCTEGVWKWSLPGQDKPLLPTASEPQWLFLQERYAIRNSSSFPTVCAPFCTCGCEDAH